MSEPAGRSTLQQQDCILVVQKVTNRVMRLLQEDDWTILRGHIETVNGKKKNNVVSSDFSSSSFRQSWTLVVLQVKQMKERKVTVRFSCTQTSNQETKDNKKRIQIHSSHLLWINSAVRSLHWMSSSFWMGHKLDTNHWVWLCAMNKQIMIHVPS